MIKGNNWPEFIGHSKSDMLIGSFREGVEFGFDPVVGSFFAARRTKAGFAGVGSFKTLITLRTDEIMKAEEGSPANK